MSNWYYLKDENGKAHLVNFDNVTNIIEEDGKCKIYFVGGGFASFDYSFDYFQEMLQK